MKTVRAWPHRPRGRPDGPALPASCAPVAPWGRAQIDGYLPHRGAMCLLSEVRAYDRDTIECVADSHHDLAHPLRAHGRLGAACAIEYAAQAMAIHGALCADRERPPAGSLLAVREARFWVARLDDIAEDLLITCHCLARDSRVASYRFVVATTAGPVAAGRATVQFTAHEGRAP